MHSFSAKQLTLIAAGLLLSALCLAPAAFAQTTGGIKGKVRNMRGDSIVGATVTARKDAREVKSTKTNNKGEFALDGLESGVYNIAFDAKGYSTGVKYSVEVKQSKTVDLGDRLIMQVDKGTQVIIEGSVFYKNGTTVTAAEVKVERVNADGSVKKIGTLMSNSAGEFSFRQPEGAAKFRITAKYKDATATKDIEVESAAIYRLALSLPIDREKQ